MSNMLEYRGYLGSLLYKTRTRFCMDVWSSFATW